jgi:drug/metabolite transporter (DMT)-like permease
MEAGSRRIRLKTRIFAIIVVLSGALGNFFLTWGLKHRSAELSYSPVAYVLAFLDPWVMLGVALLILWLLSRMALLSWADLSYVLPVTALGYVVSALMGRLLLDEHVSAQRWAGTVLIFLGIALVGRTNPHTDTQPAEMELAR